jgi:hypothetical protein
VDIPPRTATDGHLSRRGERLDIGFGWYWMLSASDDVGTEYSDNSNGAFDGGSGGGSDGGSGGAATPGIRDVGDVGGPDPAACPPADHPVQTRRRPDAAGTLAPSDRGRPAREATRRLNMAYPGLRSYAGSPAAPGHGRGPARLRAGTGMARTDG